ncbi:Exostosin domain-containing protein [Heracleum sosnowskyi]|uniref:Exostosin domain-containing protein n=1 Tax=Heracleum sosnowskyi TaxID=360622 RepID=A0AAD8MY70_9APIA|nr:Exostosin domain-containing protein [Heracleum sosnowskyi]
MKKLSYEGASAASACEVISVIILSTLLIISVLFSAVSFTSSAVRSEFRYPVVALQTKLPDHDHAVISTHFNFTVSSPQKHTVVDQVEQGLARARASIRSARNLSTVVATTDLIYRNPRAFYRSYLEMERRLKVYVYEEGELPIVHDGPCKDIYTTEGRFIQEIEQGKQSKFRTRDPNLAHLFFMPFSVTWMVKYLYTPYSYNLTPLRDFVSDYIRVISTKHPFWNKTQGADHFMLSCHDWGPHASKGNPLLYNTSIRVLCNANSSEGFNPQKDVSLPEIHLYDGNIPAKLLTPPPPSPRQYLAFFAGGNHGPIRPILLNHFKNRDPTLPIYEYLPKSLDYYTFMLTSKFCLCPSGHEVASPRIVEAIYAECVPVILSKNYVLPFSDVLRWEAFSLEVPVSDIPRLKKVLSEVPEEKYLKLKQGLRQVRKHFLLNSPAKRFDVFHMVLHSVWLRRINVRVDQDA